MTSFSPITHPDAQANTIVQLFRLYASDLMAWAQAIQLQTTVGPRNVLLELEDANHRTLDKATVIFVVPEKSEAEKQ